MKYENIKNKVRKITYSNIENRVKIGLAKEIDILVLGSIDCRTNYEKKQIHNFDFDWTWTTLRDDDWGYGTGDQYKEWRLIFEVFPVKLIPFICTQILMRVPSLDFFVSDWKAANRIIQVENAGEIGDPICEPYQRITLIVYADIWGIEATQMKLLVSVFNPEGRG